MRKQFVLARNTRVRWPSIKGKEEGSPFLKKRTKKLLSSPLCHTLHLVLKGPGWSDQARQRSQKFFASFFQKRRPCFLPPRPTWTVTFGSLCACVLLAGALPAQAELRQIPLTPPGTSVAFTSYALGLFAITGHFTRFAGQLQVDPAHPQSCTASLRIDVASLEMADPDRARLATGPKMLDQAQFPTLLYHGSCAGGHAAGLLTLHGVTRMLELTATRTGQVVTAIGTLRRQDYGIDGMPGMVGRTIKLTFTVLLPGELAALVDP